MTTARRQRLGVLILGVTVGAFSGACAMAWWNPTVDTMPIDNALKELRVTAPVELRHPETMTALRAVVEPPRRLKVRPRAQSDTGVVTRVPSTPASSLAAGDVIAEVSGRPILAIPAEVPLYRDIHVGDRGNDVRLLEELLRDRGALNEAPNSVATDATRDAVSQILEAAGFRDVAPEVVLPLEQSAVVPDGSAVALLAPVGTVLDESHPLVTVETHAPMIKGRADLLQAEHLPPKADVTVTTPRGDSAVGVVATVSDFLEASPDAPAGYDVSVPLPADLDLSPGDSVVLTVKPGGARLPAVPMTAIRHEGAQTYVNRIHDQKPDVLERVSVTVLSQAEGYAVLAEGPLSEGDEILVSP
ncbi:MAG: hypothetical protein ACK5LN_07005 [Propioniciclava sp.]